MAYFVLLQRLKYTENSQRTMRFPSSGRHGCKLSRMPDAWITIASDLLRAEIDPRGAQLSRLTDRDGRELLWDGDPSVWSGRAPLLFPIVGVLAGGNYRLGGTSYRLPRHGFARGSNFQVLEHGASAARLGLRADQATWQVYPFKFDLQVSFALAGATLSMTSRIYNAAPTPLLASFGYHPALRWPLPFGQPRESHLIEFDTEEPAPVRRIDAAGLLIPTPQPTPVVGRRLALDDSLFVDDVLIFDRVQSRGVTYGAASGPRLRVAFPDSPYLGVWTKPGARFICIEPWHGITDPVGFTGEFSEKPGVFQVPPEGHVDARMEISLATV
jgi:galactose mutarotase-like enzyme